ncbi:MAG: hypothetical protein V3W37_03150 [Candidatus Binatia bacterium]
MKARVLIISAVLCALVLGVSTADAGWTVHKLAIYAGSDSAGATDFTPIVTGADTLSILKLDATTTKAGNYVSPHPGSSYFTPGKFTAYGTADTSYVVFVQAASGFTFLAATDSLGIKIQYSIDNTTWISGAETLYDPTGNRPFIPVVSTAFPQQRVIVKWNDTDVMGLPTKTMNAFILRLE